MGLKKHDNGIYAAVASNVTGSATSNPVTLSVTTPSSAGNPPPVSATSITTQPVATGTVTSGGSGGAVRSGSAAFSRSRIVKLSTHSQVDAGGNSLIVGFVITGDAIMLTRGVEPTLGVNSVPGVLSDPATSASQLTASGVDTALQTTLSAGAYTVQLRGKNSSNGVASIEVYDAAQANPMSVVNLAVRTYVGKGADTPGVSFVIGGTEAKRVLIRAVGPTLGKFGVADVLADPQVELFRDGVRLEQNDDWGGSRMLVSVFAQVGAFALNGSGSRDAALLVTLEPGVYTIVASGAGRATGVALVELYDVP